MQYTVVEAHTTKELIEKVEDHFSFNFKPAGGVSWSNGIFIQALVSDEPKVTPVEPKKAIVEPVKTVPELKRRKVG